MKQSHMEKVCFKRLEAEGKLGSREPEDKQQQVRSQSPGGGLPASPVPKSKKLQVTAQPKLHKLYKDLGDPALFGVPRRPGEGRRQLFDRDEIREADGRQDDREVILTYPDA